MENEDINYRPARELITKHNTYFSNIYKSLIYEEQQSEIEYSKDKIFLGWIKDTDEEYYLSNRKEDVVLIVAPRGSGKSFIMRGHMNRAFLGGCKVFMPLDFKAEYRTNNFIGGIQKHLMKLGKGEQPRPIPTKMFVPKFMQKYYPSQQLPAYNNIFEFGFKDLSDKGWCTLLGVSPSDESLYTIVEEIVDKIRKDEVGDWEGIMNIVDVYGKESKIPAQTLNKMKRKIIGAKNRGVLGNQFLYNPIDDLDNNIVVQNLMYMDFIPNGVIDHQLYIGTMMEKIVRGLREKKISPPVMVYMDEMHKIAPRDAKDLISRQMTIDFINLYRDLGVRIIGATQFPAQLPTAVLSQVNKFIIPKKIDKDDRKWILDKADLYEMGDWQRGTWQEIFGEMGPFDVMVVNKNPHKREANFEIVTPASPLSYHKE